MCHRHFVIASLLALTLAQIVAAQGLSPTSVSTEQLLGLAAGGGAGLILVILLAVLAGLPLCLPGGACRACCSHLCCRSCSADGRGSRVVGNSERLEDQTPVEVAESTSITAPNGGAGLAGSSSKDPLTRWRAATAVVRTERRLTKRDGKSTVSDAKELSGSHSSPEKPASTGGGAPVSSVSSAATGSQKPSDAGSVSLGAVKQVPAPTPLVSPSARPGDGNEDAGPRTVSSAPNAGGHGWPHGPAAAAGTAVDAATTGSPGPTPANRSTVGIGPSAVAANTEPSPALRSFLARPLHIGPYLL